MLGWMDDEALHRTLTTGRTTFWSRSRQEYWVKGETSGHRQRVKEVRLDCDGDTLLVKVDQEGPACHTGDRTCFDADRRCRSPMAERAPRPRRSARPCWSGSAAPALAAVAGGQGLGAAPPARWPASQVSGDRQGLELGPAGRRARAGRAGRLGRRPGHARPGPPGRRGRRAPRVRRRASSPRSSPHGQAQDDAVAAAVGQGRRRRRRHVVADRLVRRGRRRRGRWPLVAFAVAVRAAPRVAGDGQPVRRPRGPGRRGGRRAGHRAGHVAGHRRGARPDRLSRRTPRMSRTPTVRHRPEEHRRDGSPRQHPGRLDRRPDHPGRLRRRRASALVDRQLAGVLGRRRHRRPAARSSARSCRRWASAPSVDDRAAQLRHRDRRPAVRTTPAAAGSGSGGRCSLAGGLLAASVAAAPARPAPQRQLGLLPVAAADRHLLPRLRRPPRGQRPHPRRRRRRRVEQPAVRRRRCRSSPSGGAGPLVDRWRGVRPAARPPARSSARCSSSASWRSAVLGACATFRPGPGSLRDPCDLWSTTRPRPDHRSGPRPCCAGQGEVLPVGVAMTPVTNRRTPRTPSTMRDDAEHEAGLCHAGTGLGAAARRDLLLGAVAEDQRRDTGRGSRSRPARGCPGPATRSPSSWSAGCA